MNDLLALLSDRTALARGKEFVGRKRFFTPLIPAIYLARINEPGSKFKGIARIL